MKKKLDEEDKFDEEALKKFKLPERKIDEKMIPVEEKYYDIDLELSLSDEDLIKVYGKKGFKEMMSDKKKKIKIKRVKKK
jgi:hypothetical protein